MSGGAGDAVPLLDVQGLRVEFVTDDGPVRAVEDVSFALWPGRTLAVVGESGSGKSAVALALLGLLPRTARVTGRALLDGEDLLACPERRLRTLRGSEVAMVFQDPMTALDPVFTVGSQLVEAIRVHQRDLTRRAARVRAIELLDLVGIAAAARRIDHHPHELSGGMRQRVMIAMAIANGPRLLIADEPTTALDVTVQAQVVEVLQTAQETTGAALLLISHDLGLVAGMADRVQVMYAGRLFETGDAPTIYHRSRNPYTRGLLASLPSAVSPGGRLVAIPGQPPTSAVMPTPDGTGVGCAFRPRCPAATGRCEVEEPALRPLDPAGEHHTRCHHAEELPPPAEPAVDAERWP